VPARFTVRLMNRAVDFNDALVLLRVLPVSAQQRLMGGPAEYVSFEPMANDTELTASCFLARYKPLSRLIELSRRLVRDAWPEESMTLELDPNERMRKLEESSSFGKRSLGQQMPPFVQVSVGWPRNP
jgi:hypothetical protein